MSATATLPKDVADYLERVRAELADLPAEERDELTADVEAALLDAASDSVVPLAEQLGSPERFAGELRAAAGIAPRASAVAGTPMLMRLARRVEPLLAGARDLAPIWWALRGYVAVAAIALLVGADWSARMAVLPRFAGASAGGRAVDVLIVLAAVALSIWIGRRAGRRMLPLDAALAIAIIPVLVQLSDPPRPIASYAQPIGYFAPPQTLVYDGAAVANVYPYDRRGRLLHDVRLYDGSGRSLDVGTVAYGTDPLRRAVRTADGRVLNAFPIRYFEPGTRRVAKPNAGPPVDAPPIVTPALGPRH